ncbi:MAG: hypothetical protein ACRDP8_26205, partial [Actinopolymorphaceae bacterium]
MSCTHAPRLGAYTLGVDDPERGAIERHLASCATCRSELSDLAEVAAMLTTARSAGVVDSDIDVSMAIDLDVSMAIDLDGRSDGGSDGGSASARGSDGLSDDLLDRILAAIAAERTDQVAPVTPLRRW